MAQILEEFLKHPWLSKTLIPESGLITLVAWGGNRKVAFGSAPIPQEQNLLPYAPVFQYGDGSSKMRLVGLLHPRDRVTNPLDIATDVPLPAGVAPSRWCIWKAHPFALEFEPLGRQRLIDGAWKTTNLFTNFVESSKLTPIIRKYWTFTSSRSAPRETEIILPGGSLYPEFDVEIEDEETAGKSVTFHVEVPLDQLSEEKYIPKFFSVKACETLLQKLNGPTSFLSTYGRRRSKASRERNTTVEFADNTIDADGNIENKVDCDPPSKKAKFSESDQGAFDTTASFSVPLS
eukprot:TRINITY_DN13505_c0_g1_i1.p1 TRINITY_DN13505_c0_g1~~TRINITY_DN13505_c0_g1_i1.p1  ORF type:complete len:338 (+),score=34.48 TRINITY_DN13505_c0_g1_i1:142-1014(+)